MGNKLIATEKKTKLADNANAIIEASQVYGVTSIRLGFTDGNGKGHWEGATNFKGGWTVRRERKTLLTSVAMDKLVEHFTALATGVVEAGGKDVIVHYLVRTQDGKLPVAPEVKAEGEAPADGEQKPEGEQVTVEAGEVGEVPNEVLQAGENAGGDSNEEQPEGEEPGTDEQPQVETAPEEVREEPMVPVEALQQAGKKRQGKGGHKAS